MRALFRAIGRLAQAPLSVLITGETGTGKELVARALHRESPRAARPFVALNTAAIPAELLESELFGHEAGAFTGAHKRHIGRFEQADGGTLFLDEIGDMPAALQTRLLRVLAEGEFFRVGGRELIRVDVRVIAATHQPLEALVAQGRFRADLLHRLDVVRLQLAAAARSAARTSRSWPRASSRTPRASSQLPPKKLSAPALERLRAHAWPGNVRELENVCWRLAALAPGRNHRRGRRWRWRCPPASPPRRRRADWTAAAGRLGARAARCRRRRHCMRRPATLLDRTLLDAALERCNGHRGDAAALLGLSAQHRHPQAGPVAQAALTPGRLPAMSSSQLKPPPDEVPRVRNRRSPCILCPDSPSSPPSPQRWPPAPARRRKPRRPPPRPRPRTMRAPPGRPSPTSPRPRAAWSAAA